MFYRKLALLGITLVFSLAAHAQPAPKAVLKGIQNIYYDTPITSLRPSAVPGLWEFNVQGHEGQITGDGKYIVLGDVLEVSSRRNLSEVRRSKQRATTLGNIPLGETIRFAPKTVKYVVYVFTDTDCAYCRKLHEHISEYNQAGIEVRYLAYPRAGVNSPTAQAMTSVWCASNRQAALTQVKAGKAVGIKTCNNPIAKQFALGNSFGVNGTPAIFTSTGVQIGGYLTSADLLKALKTVVR